MKTGTEKPAVLVTEACYERGRDLYESIEDLEIVPVPDDEVLLSEMVNERNPFAVVLGPEDYTGPLYEAMDKNTVIARFGVGCDGVDLEKAGKEGIFVTNTPDVLETTVAELTVFLAGELLRKPGKVTEEIREGVWNPVPGRELRNKVWAVLGLGNIGKEVSRILSFGFGVRVIALKQTIPDGESIRKEYGVETISSDYSEIAPYADIVSLHLPANEDTYHFMGKERLQQLKPGALLINTSRGSLIDEKALYDTLESGYLSGAGLDVFEHEPYRPVAEDKDLRNLANVVLTPHIGSNAEECSRRMTERVIQNIRFAIEGEYGQMDLVSP